MYLVVLHFGRPFAYKWSESCPRKVLYQTDLYVQGKTKTIMTKKPKLPKILSHPIWGASICSSQRGKGEEFARRWHLGWHIGKYNCVCKCLCGWWLKKNKWHRFTFVPELTVVGCKVEKDCSLLHGYGAGSASYSVTKIIDKYFLHLVMKSQKK